MTLNREDIIKNRRPPFEEVAVPEWGGSVVVQGMTVAMRDRFLKSLAEDRGLAPAQQVGYSTLILLRTLADSEGNLLLTEADAPLVSQLASSSAEALVAAAERVSGLALKAPAKN